MLPAGGVAGGMADEVEEIVVERALAERTGTEPGPPVEAAAPATADDPGRAEPARRRGRVTRTAGAPEPTSGDSPVAAVLTVPGPAGTEPAAADPTSEPVEPPAVAPQPLPVAASRPRRARRAASRPAGPPAGDAAEAGTDTVPTVTGDPV